MHYYTDNDFDYFDDSDLTSSTDSQESEDSTSLVIDLYGEGHFDSDSDSDIFSTDGVEYDRIHIEDSLHFYSDKVHNKYYIGLSHNYINIGLSHNYINNYTQQLLLSSSVSAQVFFKYSYNDINNYLYYYSLVHIPNHQVQILQVNIIQADGFEMVTVVNKTHWLRLVQRHWKKIYKQRKTIIQQRILTENLFYNEIHGNYPISVSYLPTIHGMLSQYNNTNIFIK